MAAIAIILLQMAASLPPTIMRRHSIGREIRRTLLSVPFHNMPNGTNTVQNMLRKSNVNYIENEHILQQMLDACSSVTTSALSCPTLGSATLRQALAAGTGGVGIGGENADSNLKSVAGEKVDANDDKVSSATTVPSTVSANETAEYADEVEIARWLDSQIAEYQAALARHDEENRLLATSSSSTTAADAATSSAGNAAGQKRKRRDAGSGTSVDATRRQKERELKRLREDIFDETVRIQQERLLISRMRMSAAAIYTTFPDAAPRPGNAKDTGTCIAREQSHDPIGLDTKSEAMKMVPNSEEEAHAAQLRREGLRSRDQLVTSGLENIGDIQQLRSRLENTNATCREWQQKNRDLWNTLTSTGGGGTSRNNLSSNVGVEETGSSDEYGETIRRENNILKRALAEAIASSGIDWFGDERLSNAFAILED